MQNLKNSFASFWKYRYLLQNLITRDFKLKYRRSVLGVAWSVLNPLLTCLVMWAVFGALFNQRGDGIEDFPLFLIIGQLMFNFFRESTSMAMESVLKNGPLLRKVYIPKYIFPLEKCCFALVNFFFSLVALFFVALVTWSHISLRTVLLAVLSASRIKVRISSWIMGTHFPCFTKRQTVGSAFGGLFGLECGGNCRGRCSHCGVAQRLMPQRGIKPHERASWAG